MLPGAGYKLGITCCFCGGLLEIDEASHTTRCSHCGSVLKIARRAGVEKYYIEDTLIPREVKFHIDRHLKKEKLPLVSRWQDIVQVYLPFWRFSAAAFIVHLPRHRDIVEFECAANDDLTDGPVSDVKITNKEISFCADERSNWGIASLGLRTQVVRLNPVNEEFQQNNHLVVPSVDRRAAGPRFGTTIKAMAGSVAKTGWSTDVSVAGLKESIIYYPIWIANFINSEGPFSAQFDPLPKRVVSIAAGELEIPPADTGGDGKSPIQIIPHRCPNCGEDLPDNARSVTYYCHNCRRLLVGKSNGYDRLRVNVPEDADPKDTLFPFWVFDLTGPGWPEQGRLLEDVNLLQMRPDRFFMPAFEISNPLRMLRLLGHYNRLNSEHEFKFTEHPTDCYSFTDVTLSAAEAARFVVVLPSAYAAVKGYFTELLRVEREFDVPQPRLVWLPYTRDRYFWRDNLTGATIEKAAVRCG